MENWKQCEQFESYEVSDMGRIRRGNRILTPWISGPKGAQYLYVSVCVNGIRKVVRLHKLIALAFVPNPDNLPEVNHKDLNKLNPKADNLEWNTSLENKLHAIAAGRGNIGKTKCIRGHKFTSENTIIRKNGSRNCRECGKLAQVEYQKRKGSK